MSYPSSTTTATATATATTANLPKVIADFRSDTVTKPTPEMLQAMMNAEVGDDVYDEDPTIHKLEKYAAELCGKEAALFCATGTMTNQLAIRSQVGALESVICDIRAHIFRYECGGVAYHSQAHIIPIKVPEGQSHMTLEMIEEVVLGENVHHAITKLIEIENTLSGSIFPFDEIKRISDFAKSKNIKMHLDGARLWNASIATGIPLNKYCELFDTVSLCLSKGLGAPVGSLLVGTKDTVHRARHFRKLFGGGWRQAGILAAAGLYAIEHQWPKLKTDHDNAQLLASLLGAIPGVKIVNKVETNMVFLNLDASLRSQGVNWNALVRRVRSSHGFILGEQGSITAPVRFVVHLQTSKENIELLAVALKEAIASEIALAAGKAAA